MQDALISSGGKTKQQQQAAVTIGIQNGAF